MGAEQSNPGYVKPTAVFEGSGLTGVPTGAVAAVWWPAFRQHCPRLAVGAKGFAEFFGCVLPRLCDEATRPPASSNEAFARAFTSLDTGKRGAVDGLELFAALALHSRGAVEDKAALIFSIFDLAGRGCLERAALGLLLERTVSGLQKSCACLGFCAQDDFIQTITRCVFSGRSPEDEMSRDRFMVWWRHDGVVRRILQRFVANPKEEEGLPGEDEWRWVHYHELAEACNSPVVGEDLPRGGDEKRLDTKDAEEAAATRIQALRRGGVERRHRREEAACATRIQAIQRGRLARRKCEER